MGKLEFKTETKTVQVTTVLWKGKPLPLAPFERLMFQRLYENDIVWFHEFPEKSRNSKAVAVSNIRRVLEKLKMPYRIPLGWHDQGWSLERVNGG